MFLYIFYFFFFGVLLLYLYFQYVFRFKGIKTIEGKPIPGPKPSFPFGNLHVIYLNGLLIYSLAKWREKYGDIFTFWIFNIPFLYVHDIELAKKISIELVTRGFSNFNKNKGIVLTYDIEHHKVHRKLVLTHLMKPVYQKKVAEMINIVTEKFINRLDSLYSNEKEFEIEVTSHMINLTLDIIGFAACSLELNAIEGKQTAYEDACRRLIRTLPKLSRFPRIILKLFPPLTNGLRENMEVLIQFHNDIINRRREERKNPSAPVDGDLLDALLDEVNPNTNQPFTKEEINADLQDILIAGHETTGYLITFALYYISLNSKWQERLQKECDGLGDRIAYENVTPQIMPCLTATVKEILRLQPSVVNYARSVTTDYNLQNKFKLPANSRIIFSSYLTGRDAKYFAYPNEFRPERWLDPVDPQFANDNHNALIVFGFGSRSCIGTRMAPLEAQIVLGKIFQKYSVKPPPSSYVFELENGISVKPKYGMPLTFEKRK